MILVGKPSQITGTLLSLVQPSSKYQGYIQRSKTHKGIKLKYFLYSRSKVHFINVSLEHVLGN